VKEILDNGSTEFASATYLASRGNRTRRPTASIKGVFALVMLGSVGSGKDTRPNVRPGAIVEGFLLYVPTCESWAMGMRKRYACPYLAPKDICIGIRIKVRYNLGNDQKPFQT
jgi:hypothetical protein